ncbi:MAG: hypothetical protein AUH72_21450 [Acidobacteria bacterium 13_1_40CM_4_65_8]|nr:MAG: hypothetical protein AUH72_21450 [Acidobacteria bacterium 13_1_40CM_4_65_8]
MTMIDAPAGDIDRLRRPLRLGHVLVTLEDLLIVTWRVPEAELRRHLPNALQPVIDAGACLVSAAVFRNRALRPAVAGFPRMRSSQMNVRAYVRAPRSGEPGSVFFLGLYVSRAWIAGMSSWLFGVPFQYLPLEVAARDEGHGVEWHARSPDDHLTIHAREADADVDTHTLDLLTNPHTAYFLDRRGVLRRWSIWHRPQAVRTMAVQQARVECMRDFTVSRPLPALYVRSVDYEVYLPPRAAS